MRPPSECPVCGHAVPPKSRACPNCGADERSGWNEDDARYDGLDLPASAYEDDEEEPAARRPRRSGRGAGPHPFWWIVALVLALLFVGSLLAPLF
jgi:hypothetical protein